MQNRLKDLFIQYDLIKRLSTPFKEMDAYKLGIIDDKGDFLIKRRDFTSEQKERVTRLDTIIINLKKLAGKFIPGKLQTYATALALLRESELEEMTDSQLMELSKNIFESILLEEDAQGGEQSQETSAPTNTQSSGRIDLTPIVKQDKYSATFKQDKNTYYRCMIGKCKKEKFEKYIEDESLRSSVQDYAKKYPSNSILLQDEDGRRIFLKYGKLGSYGIPPRS